MLVSARPDRLRALGLAAALLVVGVTLPGCVALGGGDASGEPAFARGDETARDQLNDGYSELYSSADGLSRIDTIFYVKFESDDVERVVTDVTDYSGDLAERLQAFTADFPALSLDRVVDPPIIRAARDAQKKATVKRFAPLVGESGRAFERGLLIRLLGAVDQQHYMAATLAEREPEAALSEILSNVAERYADFYTEIDALLEARFYR